MELCGSVSQVRKELEALGHRGARQRGRRALAGAGSVFCLLAAYGWGAFDLPGLIPARIALAVLLTIFTVAVLSLSAADLDKVKISQLSRVLHLLREKAGAAEVAVAANLLPLERDTSALLDGSRVQLADLDLSGQTVWQQDWFAISLEVFAMKLRLSGRRTGFRADATGRTVEVDQLTFLLSGPPVALRRLDAAITASQFEGVTASVLEGEELRTTLEEGPREPSGPAPLPRWVEWYVQQMALSQALGESRGQAAHEADQEVL